MTEISELLKKRAPKKKNAAAVKQGIANNKTNVNYYCVNVPNNDACGRRRRSTARVVPKTPVNNVEGFVSTVMQKPKLHAKINENKLNRSSKTKRMKPERNFEINRLFSSAYLKKLRIMLSNQRAYVKKPFLCSHMKETTEISEIKETTTESQGNEGKFDEQMEDFDEIEEEPNWLPDPSEVPILNPPVAEMNDSGFSSLQEEVVTNAENHIATAYMDKQIFNNQLAVKNVLLRNPIPNMRPLKDHNRCKCKLCKHNLHLLKKNAKKLTYWTVEGKQGNEVDLKFEEIKDYSNLPLKKRKPFQTCILKEENISYPATPMMSIAEIKDSICFDLESQSLPSMSYTPQKITAPVPVQALPKKLKFKTPAQLKAFCPSQNMNSEHDIKPTESKSLIQTKDKKKEHPQERKKIKIKHPGHFSRDL